MQIAANGITLEVEEHGDPAGVPLVLIRGLGSQIVNWAPSLIAGFADHGYRVVTFDNRDAGLSQRCPAPGATGDPNQILAEVDAGRTPRPTYGLDDMALDVVGLMDSLGVARAHVFGISMGGAITQILAMSHADRLLSATMVMTGARLRGIDMIGKLLVYPETREEYIASALKGDADWGSPGYPAPRDWTVDVAGRAWDRGAQADAVNRQLLATLNADDRREGLTRVALPCLVIHGADDTLIPADAGREIAALVPGAELEVIDGMGHIITPLLGPIVAERVRRFHAGL